MTVLVLAAVQQPFELKEGDRVVLVGDALVEREQEEGWIETTLLCRWPGRKLTFRNLGWGGDTVWGHARAVFGRPEDGFQALRKLLGELKPSVIFAAYGMSESFSGQAGLSEFEAGLRRLLEMLKESGPRRIVLLSPIRHEDLGRPLPDPTEHNNNLKLYRDAMEKIAREGDRALFVDLFQSLPAGGPWTSDGIHLTAQGYRRAAQAIERGLGFPPSRLDDGNPNLAKLRARIVEKNRFYFNQWRAQNVTYLFLFRKHEQGRNAVEIPQFDRYIAEKEAEIAGLAPAAAAAFR